ncbi:MAG: transporter substrate-binding domain-containing protein [Bacteroidota bacterium]
MNKTAKLFFFIGAFGFVSLHPLTAQLKGDTYASAKASKSATLVLTHSNAPGFAAQKGTVTTGITFDIMERFKTYVQDTKGISITYTLQTKNADNFTQFLDEVKNSSGGVFGLSNTTITTARKRVYNFSPPYITNIGMIVTHNSVPTLSNMSEVSSKFAGMTAVTVKNSTNEKRILDIKKTHYPNLKIQYVNSFSEAMDMITKDPTKFSNLDFTYYFEAVQARKPVKRHPGGDDKTEQFGIIMPKSNDWSPLLAEFMNSGFVGGTDYKKIVANNLGQSAMKFFDTLK